MSSERNARSEFRVTRLPKSSSLSPYNSSIYIKDFLLLYSSNITYIKIYEKIKKKKR